MSRNPELIRITVVVGTTPENSHLSISSLPPRFAANLAISPTGCWEWQGRRDPAGYGRFSDGKRYGTNITHRIAYMALVGPIPNGKEIDHLCRNRACANIAHLEPVTHRENLQRGAQGAKTHCDWGHPLSGDNVVMRYRKNGIHTYRQCRACLQRRNREQIKRGRK